jgi:hypothetical protein
MVVRVIVAMLAVAGGLLIFAFAGSAVAQDSSGGGEYVPAVPDGGGARPEKDIGSGSDGTSSGSLPPATNQGLSSQGSDGAETAEVAEATAPEEVAVEETTAPARTERKDKDKDRKPAKKQERTTDDKEPDAIKTQTAGLEGSERIGGIFPLLLGLGLLAAGAGLYLRHRRRML